MKVDNDNRKIWLNGKIVPLQEANINILTPTSQFGINVFEGIRCYWNEQERQLFAFRLEDHFKRLRQSMKMLRLEDRYSDEELRGSFFDVIRANNFREDIVVRQTIFLDGTGSWNSKGPVGMFVAPIPKGRAYDSKPGINACISTWERINDRAISPRIKAGANYINSRMAQMEALENGFDTAILRNSQGKISEGPGSCLFIVRDNELATPPVTASVLESITRGSLIELAKKELNLMTVERGIDRTELYISDEVFLCGTTMEIVSILSIDRLPINDGKPGRITEALKNIFFEVARGKKEEYKQWLTPIFTETKCEWAWPKRREQ